MASECGDRLGQPEARGAAWSTSDGRRAGASGPSRTTRPGSRRAVELLSAHARGAGGDRAPRRGAGRAAAGGRAGGAGDPSQPGRRRRGIATASRGGKSDAFDAFVLGRAGAHRRPPLPADLTPTATQTRALRALTRAREDLVEHAGGAGQPAGAQLERFWPGAAQVFADLDSPIALAFLAALSRPADAKRPRARSDWSGFLARHRYSRPPAAPSELLERLAARPPAAPATLEADARRASCSAWSPRWTPLVGQIAELDRADRQRPARPSRRRDLPLACFADPKTAVTAAALLAEIGDCRDRYPTAAALAADAGQAPSPSSPANAARRFRRACDKRLRSADRRPRRHQPPPQPLGRRHLPPRPRPRLQTTPTPSASSAAPGCASSGAAGTTTPPTTPPATAACHASSPPGG